MSLSLATSTPSDLVAQHEPAGRSHALRGPDNLDLCAIILPRVETIDIEVTNRLLTSAQVFKTEGRYEEHEWRWTHCDESALSPRANWTMQLRSGDCTISLEIVREDTRFCEAEFDPSLFSGDAKTFACALRYAPVIQLIDQITGRQWTIAEAASGGHDLVAATLDHARINMSFDISDRAGAVLAAGRIAFSQADAAIWLESNGTSERSGRLVNIVPIRLSVRIGQQVLNADELVKLSVGSAVVVAAKLGGQSAVHLCTPCGRWQRPGALDNGAVTLTGDWLPSPQQTLLQKDIIMEAALSSPTDERDESNQLPAEVPINLTFEIGQATTTIAQLETQFRKGFVLTIDESLHKESVRICANGVEIAKGELLQLGESLAVRITKVQGHGSR